MLYQLAWIYIQYQERLRIRLGATEDPLEQYRLIRAIHRHPKLRALAYIYNTLDKNTQKVIIKLPHPQHMDGGPGSGNFGHKGVPGQVGGSAPSGPAQELSDAIATGRVSTKLDRKKQSKHTKGTPAYEKAIKAGKKVSVMYLSDSEIQRLVSKYSGKGHIRIKNGQIKETFEHTSVIGTYVSRTGEVSETKRGTIHYSKSGTHVVPSLPR